MFSWISDRVEEYCDSKFREASAVIDEQVVRAVVLCEDHLTIISLNADVKFKEDVVKMKIRLANEMKDKELEMVKLIEGMDVNAELSKCFDKYIEKNMVTLHPAIVLTPLEMRGYKNLYDLELIRMSSFKGEGTSSMTGGAKIEDAHRSAKERGVAEAMGKARESGSKIGAEIAYLHSASYCRGSWSDSREKQTCSSSTTATVSVHFYKIKGEKVLENEVITEDEDPEDSSVSTEESYSETN